MTSFGLKAVDRSKLSLSIVDQLVEAIRTGGFLPGAALPAERLLAVQLGVSRSSVREAIRVLEHAGVLDVRTGSGTFVTDAGVSNVAMLRAQAALLGDQSPLDVIVARLALEPVCAELAALNRRDKDVATLRASVELQAALVERDEDPTDIDLDFHQSIAAAAQNPVLLLLVERLTSIMRQGTWRELKQRTGGRNHTFRLFLAQHASILDAIERSDGSGARERMREHLVVIQEGLLHEVEAGAKPVAPTPATKERT
jgi:GntR family transcriptional repressor for pyruvate dehydrogenase complex